MLVNMTLKLNNSIEYIWFNEKEMLKTTTITISINCSSNGNADENIYNTWSQEIQAHCNHVHNYWDTLYS